MAIPRFGVTDSEVRDFYFPQLAAFSSSTTPTDSTVDGMVNAEAAILAGRLASKDISSSTIDTDAGATYPIAYAWCADTVRLGVAVRAAQAMAGFGPNAEAWSKELAARYEQLDKYGYSILGDAVAPSEEPNGPRWHVGNHSLDTGNESDISDAIPRFRRDDEL